jgi:hypothetical protein
MRPGAKAFPPYCPREKKSMPSIQHIGPVTALIAGILILIMPRLLNYIIAIYLILTGLVGLGTLTLH